jgi:hypothetical protein
MARGVMHQIRNASIYAVDTAPEGGPSGALPPPMTARS